MYKYANFNDAIQLNNIFIEAVNDPDMLKEAENRGAEFLKLQVYEDSFHERILPAQSISPMQCDRDVNSPNYQVVIDKEFTDVRAVTSSLRGGGGNYEYVETDRYAVVFYTLESPEYALTEQELRGKRQPVQDLIRHHVAYHIRKKMDETWMGMSKAAVAASGLEKSLVAAGEKIITPQNLADLRRLIDNQSTMGRYLRGSTILLTQSQYNYINTWPQANTASGVGTATGMQGGLGTDFWRDGYKYDTLFGLRVIRTVKSDLVGENEIYLYTEPEYLGHHFTFNDDKFSIMKHHYTMKWKGYRTYGAAIGNENAVARLVLDDLG